MNTIRNSIFTLTLTLAIALLTLLSLLNKPVINGEVVLAQSQYRPVNVSANIGGQSVSLFGYTSPKALVTFQGIGIFHQTYANADGRFELNLPLRDVNQQSFCVFAKDSFGRITSPVCPNTNNFINNMRFGPILLPPTLSLGKSTYYSKDEVQISGQTVPKSSTFLTMFVKNSYALPFDKVELVSDEYGNFDVSIPSVDNGNITFFTQVSLLETLSSQSTILSITILPLWYIFIEILQWLYTTFRPYLGEIIILIQLSLLLSFVLVRTIFRHNVAYSFAIVKHDAYPIVKYTPPNRSIARIKGLS